MANLNDYMPLVEQDTIRAKAEFYARARAELDEISSNETLIGQITFDMHRLGHRWHDTPPGKTPTHEQVAAVLSVVCDMMFKTLKNRSETEGTCVGTGGIFAVYFKWPHGNSEFRVFYSNTWINRTF